MEAVLRLAVRADGPAVAELARASVLEVFPAYRDAVQTVSAAEHITTLDTALIDDGPGVPLSKASGFTEVEAAQLPMPDSTVLAGVAMERPIEETA
ncbi:hypothetical protein [Kribbella sp. NPDC049584]|uniref:hypothetical protein n=1 Tax=Kribbella sp. NPDC049584 TaxID=3154833 RepID=UPI00343FF601